jgi:hypothetical protein
MAILVLMCFVVWPLKACLFFFPSDGENDLTKR